MMTIGIAPPASAKTLKLRIEMVSLHRAAGLHAHLPAGALAAGSAKFRRASRGGRNHTLESVSSGPAAARARLSQRTLDAKTP